MLHFQNDLLSEVLQKIGENEGQEGYQKQHVRGKEKGRGKYAPEHLVHTPLCLCTWVSIKIKNIQTFLSSAHVWRVIIQIRKLNFISLGSSR